MKYLITTIIIVTILYIIPNTYKVVAEDNFQFYKLGDVLTKQEVSKIISLYATGTKAYQMLRTIECESHYKNIQSLIVKNGVREDSWGIAQINLYWNDVSKEQALDPYYSINFMSDNWENIKWYGYIKSIDSCNSKYK